ncbi:MAG: winged helix-turn-helix transcriptional regulator [Halioglobus sp.]
MNTTRVQQSENTEPRCPINHSMLLFGDRWSLLIIRDMLFLGKRRYKEFLSSPERISTNILANRLKQLQNCGLVEKFPDTSDRKASIYLPTDAGIALTPVLVELIRWGMEKNPNGMITQEMAIALADPDYDLKGELMTSIRKQRKALTQG